MQESFGPKQVWIKMQTTATVYKVFIVSNPDKLDELVDFDIKIGR